MTIDRPVRINTFDPDVITIDRLEVSAYVGVHDFEHRARQALRFDIEIETVPDYRRLVLETSEYLSYSTVVDFIEAKAKANEHVDLVEDWAEDVAAFVLGHPLAAGVMVKVTKPEIYDQAAGVGIRIVRRRSEARTR